MLGNINNPISRGMLLLYLRNDDVPIEISQNLLHLCVTCNLWENRSEATFDGLLIQGTFTGRKPNILQDIVEGMDFLSQIPGCPFNKCDGADRAIWGTLDFKHGRTKRCFD